MPWRLSSRFFGLRALLSSFRQTVKPIGGLVARPFVKAGISPNAITLAAVPLSMFSALAAAQGYFALGFALAAPAVFLDFLDGAVARASGKESPFGNHLEAVVDRFVEGAILVGLSVHYPVLATSALTFSMLVSYIKARVGLVVPSDNRDWPGVGDRADRMLILLVALLLMALGRHEEGRYALGFLTALAALGSVQRVLHSRTLIEEAERQGRLIT